MDTAGGGLALLARRPTGPGVEGDGPTSIAVDPTGTFAVTANERSDNLTVLDLGTRRATAWIPVHERPLDVALFDGGQTAVVWHADGDLSVVDVASGAVLTRFPTGAPAFWLPYPVKQKRMVSFAADRVLLYAAPTAVTVEVNGAASCVFASHTVSFATWPEQPCTVSESGIVAFPRSNLHEVHLVDAETLIPLHDVSRGVPRDVGPLDGRRAIARNPGCRIRPIAPWGLPKMPS